MLITTSESYLFKESVEQLYKDVIQRYINMGAAQYLRDYRSDHNLKKSAELRKRVSQRQEKQKEQNDSVPYEVWMINMKEVQQSFWSFCLLQCQGKSGFHKNSHVSYHKLQHTLMQIFNNLSYTWLQCIYRSPYWIAILLKGWEVMSRAEYEQVIFIINGA